MMRGVIIKVPALKKLTCVLFMLTLSVNTQAREWLSFCGEIASVRTWGDGTDDYGIWIGYKTNPSNCSGGFYVAHEATNKNFVFSQVLAAKTTNETVCIQTALEYKIAERCKLNSISN
jgi:hypothetical protein